MAHEIVSGFGHKIIPESAPGWGHLNALQLQAAAEANADTTAHGTSEDEERIYKEVASTARLGGAALFPEATHAPLDHEVLRGMIDSLSDTATEPVTRTLDAAVVAVAGGGPVVDIHLPESIEEEGN